MKTLLIITSLFLASCANDEQPDTIKTKSMCLTEDCSDATAFILDDKNLTAPAVVVKRCHIIRRNNDGSIDAVGIDSQGRIWRYTARRHDVVDRDGVTHYYSGTGSICNTCKC